MSASSKKKLRKEQNAETMTERQKKERAEAKKTKAITVSFVIVLALIVAIFVGSLVMNIINETGVIEKNTVAATVGSHKLNSVIMNYFYVDAIDSEYSSASETAQYYTNLGMTIDAASMLGYDVSQPLSAQTNTTTGKTWAEYYWDAALNNAKTVYAMYDKAIQDGHQLSADASAAIDQNIMYMQFSAAYSNTDLNGLLRSIYGNGANEKTYREYQVIRSTAAEYYQKHQSDKTFTSDERTAYLNEHPNDYTAYSYNYYTVNYQNFLPELEEGATATDEQKNAAREEAKNTAAALATMTSIEELDAAIAALAYNEGKTVSSTASTDVMHTSTSLTDEQREWISAADRKAGDAKSFEVKTSATNQDGTTTETIDSYRVMMYVSTNDFSRPLANVRHVLIAFEHNHTDEEHEHDSSTSSTTYTDEEKAAAKTKAETLMNAWDKTEASFIELVKSDSADEASVENGGLYEDIYYNASYETNFLNWSVDPARKAGDYGIVETSYGYHIMYYVGDGELTNREYMINQDLLSEHMTAWEEEIVTPVTVTPGKTNKIKFDLIVSQLMGI